MALGTPGPMIINALTDLFRSSLLQQRIDTLLFQYLRASFSNITKVWPELTSGLGAGFLLEFVDEICFDDDLHSDLRHAGICR